MISFDPNSAALPGSGIFGLPTTKKDARLVFVPVPWEVTTSYGGGTSRGPQAILSASHQVDLFDLEVLRPYEAGLFMEPESREIVDLNARARSEAQKIIEAGGQLEGNPDLQQALARVNQAGERLNQVVFEHTRGLLGQNKIVGIVGGDHSVPFGALQAVAMSHESFGVLHFDAHSDTRKAYEGFTWSHASIMHNVLTRIPQVSRLVQVGIRDVCEEEIEFCNLQGDRVQVFYDVHLAERKMSGANWARIASEIIEKLPQNVWISFDIDGLDPRYCPHTGTPVPGGLDFHEANHLIRELVRSKRKIVGFDLNEVSPATGENDTEWDANVGARLLYKLSAWTLASQGIVLAPALQSREA